MKKLLYFALAVSVPLCLYLSIENIKYVVAQATSKQRTVYVPYQINQDTLFVSNRTSSAVFHSRAMVPTHRWAITRSGSKVEVPITTIRRAERIDL